MRCYPRIWSFLVVLVGSVCGTSTACWGVDDFSDALPQIIASWKQRERDITTAQFNVSVARTDRRGSIQLRTLAGGPDPAEFPLADTTYEFNTNFRFDGQRIRYTYDGKVWSGTTRTLVDIILDASFDGRRATLYSTPFDDLKYPTATRAKSGESLHAHQVFEMTPILCFVRPQTMGGFTEPIQKMLAFDENGSSREEIAVRGPRGKHLWFNVATNFSMVRNSSERPDGRLVSRIDVEYLKDARHGWIPTEWTALQFDEDGKETKSFTCKVTSYEINAPMDNSDFEIDFPVGTRVRDDDSGKVFAVDDNGQLVPQ